MVTVFVQTVSMCSISGTLLVAAVRETLRGHEELISFHQNTSQVGFETNDSLNKTSPVSMKNNLTFCY